MKLVNIRKTDLTDFEKEEIKKLEKGLKTFRKDFIEVSEKKISILRKKQMKSIEKECKRIEAAIFQIKHNRF